MALNKPRKNLLLCLDAFGTLFKPTRSIAAQYGEVGRNYGINGFTDDELASTFKRGSLRAIPILCHRSLSPLAFKEQSKDCPNYGKASNMGSRQWWTSVRLFIAAYMVVEADPSRSSKRLSIHSCRKAPPSFHQHWLRRCSIASTAKRGMRCSLMLSNT